MTVERRDPTEELRSKRKGVPIGQTYYGTRQEGDRSGEPVVGQSIA